MGLLYTNIIPKKPLREAQLNALKIMDGALTMSYGPDGSTTAIRKKNTNVTTYTKDGHTILGDINMNRPIELTMRDDLVDITTRIVSTVGDGTTSAVKASYLIFKAMYDANKKYGISELVLVKQLEKAIKEAIKIIENNKRTATIEDIYNIALISTNGNEEVAQNISDIYRSHGMDVYIDVGISNSVDSVQKSYDGLTVERGYFASAFINNRAKKVSRIRNPKIYVFEDPIDTPEMIMFFDKIMMDNVYQQDKTPTVVFCPKISADMNSTFDELVNLLTQAEIEARPPFLVIPNIFDGNVIADVATMCGARTIKKYINPQIQNMDIAKGLAPTPETLHEFAGSADLVEADSVKTKIVNPKLMLDEEGNPTAIYKGHLEGLTSMLEQYQQTKEDIVAIDLLKRRINSLKANMVDYLVGGVSLTDRESVRALVVDAVLNCRSAATDGFGFGANFEAFRAFNYLENVALQSMSEEEKAQVVSGEKFNIYSTLNGVYAELLSALYFIYCNEDKEKALELAMKCIQEESPFNIRTEEFDGKVLCSIKSDPIILDAIYKIIGIVFTTNQYLCEAPEYNVYVDPE